MWRRLATFLEVHAATEERVFYPALLKASRGGGHDATDETLDAIKDHNEIRDTVAAVRGETAGSAGWFKAVAAANKANGDHMAEEEREGLTDFRRAAPIAERHALGVAFIAFETAHNAGVAAVDIDPAAYVAANR